MTGTDNATDCAAVRALYAAFNNAPSSWTGGMNRGLSYCDWDANTLQCDTYGRVTALCAPARPAPRLQHCRFPPPSTATVRR